MSRQRTPSPGSPGASVRELGRERAVCGQRVGVAERAWDKEDTMCRQHAPAAALALVRRCGVFVFSSVFGLAAQLSSGRELLDNFLALAFSFLKVAACSPLPSAGILARS